VTVVAATQPTRGVEPPLKWALQRHPLVAYFVMASAFSWLMLVVLAAWLSLPTQVVVLVFTIGPAFAAIAVVRVVEETPGLRDLWRRLRIWRVGVGWYAVVLLGVPLLVLASTLLTPGAIASFVPTSPVRWLVTYVVVFVIGGVAGGPLFEEIGWRGFALPRLQVQMGPLGGTLVLGVMWAVWHLPQYALLPEWVAQNGGADPASVLAFFVLVMALSPLMTWLFNNTRGSVLLAVLTHASVNTALMLVPGQLFPAAASNLVPFAVAFSVVAIALVLFTRGRLGQPLGAARLGDDL
jgi:CAAX protease family protein